MAASTALTALLANALAFVNDRLVLPRAVVRLRDEAEAARANLEGRVATLEGSGILPTSVQTPAPATMVAGVATFALTVTASSKIMVAKEVRDPAADGALTVTKVNGAPGSVTVTSADNAETSTIRILVIG